MQSNTGVGVGTVNVVVVGIIFVVVVTLPPVHMYESPGTNVQAPRQSLMVAQQDPSGPFLRFLL